MPNSHQTLRDGWQLLLLPLIHSLTATEFLHVKPGKGAAFVRSKLKNYITGSVVEKTFRAGESLTAATIEKRETQFTYQDGDDVSRLWPS